MKILQVHNFYREQGGEDRIAEAEAELLTAHGHQVVRFLRDNDDLAARRPWQKVRMAVNTVWARDTERELEALLAAEKPAIAHFHNTLPLISPAAYYACSRAGVPVVQTLHNFRLVCPSALLFRDGKPCTECVGKRFPWPALAHGCYRQSRGATATVAAMVGVHRILRTWRNRVDMFITLSEFARSTLLEAGLFDGAKVALLPNFVDIEQSMRSETREYAMYVGRLSAEKGVETVIEAWRRIESDVPLLVVGDGSLRKSVEEQIAESGRTAIRLAGFLPHDESITRLRRARFLVVPSVCFENCPVAVAEAFACGVPVICSRTGSLAEMVEDGRTGMHFRPGDAADLASKVDWACAHPAEMDTMGRNARMEYEKQYTAGKHYEELMAMYDRVLNGRDTALRC